MNVKAQVESEADALVTEGWGLVSDLEAGRHNAVRSGKQALVGLLGADDPGVAREAERLINDLGLVVRRNAERSSARSAAKAA